MEARAEPVAGVAGGVLLVEGGLVIGCLCVPWASPGDPGAVDELVVFAEADEDGCEDPGDGGEVNLTVALFGPGECGAAAVAGGVVLSSQQLGPLVV